MRQYCAETRPDMKSVEYKKPVSTIPDGVWESSRPNKQVGKSQKCTASTDLQGNGYPAANGKSAYTDAKQRKEQPDDEA